MGLHESANRRDLFILWGKGKTWLWVLLHNMKMIITHSPYPAATNEWTIFRLQYILLFLECTRDGCSSSLHLVLHCNWLSLGEPIYLVVSVYATTASLFLQRTCWLYDLLHFRSMKLVVLPVFFVVVILWAVMFCQFWKRKNSALLARYYTSNDLLFFYFFSSQCIQFF